MNYLIALTLLLHLSFSETEIKKYGPFQIPKWESLKFTDQIEKTTIQIIEFPDKIEGTLFSSRIWRMALNYKFLASYKTEENSAPNVPPREEWKSWYERGQCKVGTDMTDSNEDECWTNLKDISRDRWIGEKKLRIQPPAGQVFRSTCSRYWSCSAHKVTFPLYTAITDGLSTLDLYFSGPDGRKLSALSKTRESDTMGVQIEDSFFIYKSFPKDWEYKNREAICLTNSKNVTLCNIDFGERQITVKFLPNKQFAIYNNFLLKISHNNLKRLKRSITENPSASASMGDLHEIENKLLIMNEDMLVEYHQILTEVTDLKNILRETLLSISKIDDHLLGKIGKLPARTVWLNQEHFLLQGSQEMFLHNSEVDEKTNCLSTYVYDNGRWVIQHPSRPSCLKWNNSVMFPILRNNLAEPISIKDAPEFREPASEYSGWSFLDNGRASLDYLDPSIKYHGDTFIDGILGGLNLNFYLTLILYLVVGLIAIKIIMSIIRK